MIEAFLIPDLSGYYITYKDISNLALSKRINANWFHQLKTIEQRFGGTPISKDALSSMKDLVSDLLPYHIPTEYYKYEEHQNDIYQNSDYGAVLFLDEFAFFDSDGRYLFYKERNKESEWQFFISISAVTDAFKSGKLEDKYYDKESSIMEPINMGFWCSDQWEII